MAETLGALLLGAIYVATGLFILITIITLVYAFPIAFGVPLALFVFWGIGRALQ